jgi:glutamine amidotransferase/cyclase
VCATWASPWSRSAPQTHTHTHSPARANRLAKRYYDEGADEITFLNITSFRSEPLEDAPLLAVLEEASRSVFVPLTIGGGIRDYTDTTGKHYSALKVADRYFRAGADKVSIGGDAVEACERLLANKLKMDGTSSIEQISKAYGAQAVVISVDPRRVYLDTEDDVQAAKQAGHTVIEVLDLRSDDQQHKVKVWYQCTVKGGREGRPLDAVRLCELCEMLGAGEILLNSIDCDGQKKGFDVELVKAVAAKTKLPIIASSGAGSAQHFVDVFSSTRAEAALAAGMFHRKEVAISEVKAKMREAGLAVRE